MVHLQVGDGVSESFDAIPLLCQRQLVLLQRLLEVLVPRRCFQKLSRSYRRRVRRGEGAVVVLRRSKIIRDAYYGVKVVTRNQSGVAVTSFFM